MNLRYTDTVLLFKPKVMSQMQLPTYVDTYRHYISILDEDKNGAINSTVDSIIKIWESASVPYYTYLSIRTKLARYFEIVSKMKKSVNRNFFSASYDNHMHKYDVILDICTCQCNLDFPCHCKKGNRIPVAEKEFILDQRSSRTLCIELHRRVATSIQSRIYMPPSKVRILDISESDQIQSTADSSSTLVIL